MMPATGTFVFGPFRLEGARRELLAHGVPVSLGQRAFEVLLALVRRRGDLVTKDELMAEVWPGIAVEENNLQVHVSTLRKVLGAAGDGERYLLTVAGRGYRFVAPVDCESGAQPDAAWNERTAAAAARGRSAPHNLPQPPTSLIGRETELTEIKARLGSRRVVTLTGAGGVGKTRLAIEAGRALLHDYSDGVWLTELAPLSDPQLVAAVVANATGVTLTGAPSALDGLASALESKHLLLVIDNCEHVIAEVARVTEALVRQCARLSILASSRERLAVPGESVIRVPSLPAPVPEAASTADSAREYAAVQLFAERASALGHGFALTDGNAVAVSSICRRLDGIPLAIELAVPRLTVLSVQQIEQGLDERFRLLTRGSRTALPRQQTLHALIDWSYGLLTDAEKLLLARLSVFFGGSTLASITAVAAAELPPQHAADLLLSLVDKSLVQADLTSNETRYRLLESTRYFAYEKLTDAPHMRRRHAEHFATRLADATAAWERTPTRRWLDLYAADIDNLRGALEWAFAPDGDVAVGLDLVGRSHVIWAELGLMLEHRHWVDAALAKVAKRTPADVTARLLSWQAGDVRELEDPTDHDEAMRAAALFRKLGDEFHEGRMLLRAGMAQLLPDDVQQGEGLLQKAYALVRPAGATKTLARCLGALASARLFAGDPTKARSLHEQALRVYHDLGESVEDRGDR